MFKKDNKSESSSKKQANKKINKIAYDEHFTRATESIDLAKNIKFKDIDDGISKRQESELDKLTK